MPPRGSGRRPIWRWRSRQYSIGGDSMKYLLFAFLICGLATNLSAGDITVLNPSFENQVFSLGTGSGPWPFGPITDWTEIQTDGTAYSVYHPGPGSYPDRKSTRLNSSHL